MSLELRDFSAPTPSGATVETGRWRGGGAVSASSPVAGWPLGRTRPTSPAAGEDAQMTQSASRRVRHTASDPAATGRGARPRAAGRTQKGVAARAPGEVGSGGGPRARADGAKHPMPDSDANLTRLLRAAASGDRRDLDALMAAIYDDVHRLAAGHLRAERSDHTLQPTALVHEAYMKLIDQRSTDWKDRVHFFSVASRIIRRILVDHAREKLAAKRGGRAERVPLTGIAAVDGTPDVDLVALDEALAELETLSERQARIVELRYFGGLTVPEVARALCIGARSVDREWKAAKAWLFCRLAGEATERPDAARL